MKRAILTVAVLCSFLGLKSACSDLPCQSGDPICDTEATASLLLSFQSSTLGGSALGILRTGQSLCYDTAGASYPCPLVGYPFQDGEIQQGSPRQFSLTADGHIKEGISGLIWQRCQLGYSDSGCATPDPQTTFTVAEANTQCSALGEGWRLPTIQEISTLVDSGRSSPAYDSVAFPGGSFANPFWSASADAVNAGNSFVLSLDLGVLTSQPDGNSNAVRCVRGPVHSISHTYSTAGENFVLDTVTGLTWQKCANGQTLPDCTGAITIQGWQAALQYCRDLTLDGRSWRLPNRNELQSLLDFSSMSPRINQEYFPNASTGNFWSGTTFHNSTSQAWAVDFNSGVVALNGKGGTGPGVRCVSDP